MIRYIKDEQHYAEVIERISRVQHHLWIGTADLKDLYVKSGEVSMPLLGVLDSLIHRGVEVRLLHAKEPGPNFRNDFDYRVSEPDGCRSRNERLDDPQFRGGNIDR